MFGGEEGLLKGGFRSGGRGLIAAIITGDVRFISIAPGSFILELICVAFRWIRNSLRSFHYTKVIAWSKRIYWNPLTGVFSIKH